MGLSLRKALWTSLLTLILNPSRNHSSNPVLDFQFSVQSHPFVWHTLDFFLPSSGQSPFLTNVRPSTHANSSLTKSSERLLLPNSHSLYIRRLCLPVTCSSPWTTTIFRVLHSVRLSPSHLTSLHHAVYFTPGGLDGHSPSFRSRICATTEA